MRFTKMQGLGNDYVYVNCLEQKVENPSALAVKLSDRHFGVGADGLILIKPSEVADFCMDMYNADGSQSEMCGNGIRCVGKYVYDYGLTQKTDIAVETLAGIKYLKMIPEDGKIKEVTVDMGVPLIEPQNVPVYSNGLPVLNEPVEVAGEIYKISCVSMGNPHAVIFVEDIESVPVATVGPAIENHPMFPNKANVEFVQLLNGKEVKMRVWERGTGETLACGTGACACTVVCILKDMTEDEIIVHLRGGDLRVYWDEPSKKVFLTGPATTVFDGILPETGEEHP